MGPVIINMTSVCPSACLSTYYYCPLACPSVCPSSCKGGLSPFPSEIFSVVRCRCIAKDGCDVIISDCLELPVQGHHGRRRPQSVRMWGKLHDALTYHHRSASRLHYSISNPGLLHRRHPRKTLSSAAVFSTTP